MNHGAALLIGWLKRTHTTQAELAREMGVHFTLVSQWTRGERRPGLAKAVILQSKTGIPVHAWAASPVDESADEVWERPANVRVGRK